MQNIIGWNAHVGNGVCMNGKSHTDYFLLKFQWLLLAAIKNCDRDTALSILQKRDPDINLNCQDWVCYVGATLSLRTGLKVHMHVAVNLRIAQLCVLVNTVTDYND